MSTVTITEFLLARIAEDRALADLAGEDYYAVDGGGLRWGEVGFETTPDLTVDPARVRAECEAKRQIMTLHEPIPYYGLDPEVLAGQRQPELWYCDCQAPDGMITGVSPCDTLRILASVYANHPDFDESWRVVAG